MDFSFKQRKLSLFPSLRTFMLNLVWTSIVFLQCSLKKSEGHKRCHSSSPLCRHSLEDDPFLCPSRGHFPHSSENKLYFKCRGKGFYPCLCSCEVEEMYFDRICRQCKFSFLKKDGKVNCSTRVKTWTPATTDKQRLEQQLEFKRPPRINVNTTDVLRYNPFSAFTNRSGSLPSLDIDLNQDDTNWKNSKQNKSGHYRVIANEISKIPEVKWRMPEVFELRDPSLIPAWAIAFIVLGLVLIMVGVILIIY